MIVLEINILLLLLLSIDFVCVYWNTNKLFLSFLINHSWLYNAFDSNLKKQVIEEFASPNVYLRQQIYWYYAT